MAPPRMRPWRIASDGFSLVRTPHWTDYPEKMRQFGYTTENSLSADDVAKSMLELVSDGKYGGGTCL
jgi:hypothetical protein